MPNNPKSGSLVFVLFAVAILTTNSISAAPQAASSPQTTLDSSQRSPAKSTKASDEAQDDTAGADEDLSPADVQLDVSKESPLIKVLYQATRETKEKAILAQLDQARRLIDNGSDVKASDSKGRTALHWAVFGSSYNTKSTIVVAYEEIADALIQKGVDINKEDAYNDTAFDYLLYSPNFEMQTLLIEHGASSGFLAAFYHYFDETTTGLPPTHAAAVTSTRKADLAPGATMSVRLLQGVSSNGSRTGDPIEGTVTYPLCKSGENIECPPGELLVPPGTKINGTILFAQKAPNKYSRPRIVLDFSNIVHKNGDLTPLYARVLDVDNARETVRNNEILGIIQPHASTKVSIAMAALSVANPISGYSIKGVQTVYGLSILREVVFPPGTDTQIQVVRPSMLKQKDAWPGWPKLTADAELEKLVQTAPLRTHSGATPSDLTNLMFLGTQKQLISAFGEAGWFEADDLSVRSALKTVQATMRQTGYSRAPVSSLTLNGRMPDLVFQKSLDTFAKRHHLRIWKLEKMYNSQEVWVGAATHDIATENSRGKTKWSHRIDPHVDRERDWVETDLLFAGTATAYIDIDRPNAPRKLANATGDDIVTDGKMTVVELGPARLPGDNSRPVLQTRPAGQ